MCDQDDISSVEQQEFRYKFLNDQTGQKSLICFLGVLVGQHSSSSSQSQLKSLTNLLGVSNLDSSSSYSEKERIMVGSSWQIPSALRNTAFETLFTNWVNSWRELALLRGLVFISWRLRYFSLLEVKSYLASSSKPSEDACTTSEVLEDSEQCVDSPKDFSQDQNPQKLENEGRKDSLWDLSFLNLRYLVDQMRQMTQTSSLKMFWLKSTIISTKRPHTSVSRSRSSMNSFFSLARKMRLDLMTSVRGALAGAELLLYDLQMELSLNPF